MENEYKNHPEVNSVIDSIVNTVKSFNDKYAEYENSCNILKSKGYIPETFFYAIGGGEDEDDDTIFVKGEKYLWWDYSTDTWYTGLNSERNYTNGGDPNEQKIDIYSL